MRASDGVRLGVPLGARCSPRALPGRTLPVVGVTPWRTRSTTVGPGVSDLVAADFLARREETGPPRGCAHEAEVVGSRSGHGATS